MSGLNELEFAIAIVDNCVKIAFFIKNWVEKAKQYGDDVRIMRKQVAIEAARLQSFSSFLKKKTIYNKTRFQVLPVTHQSVIVGMIQELEILFYRYSAAIAKYKIEDLQRGYELESGTSADRLSNREALQVEGMEESRITQEKAKRLDKATWGLFKQKKISQVISSLESWNNKLMSFLICGIYFLEQPELWHTKAEDQEDQRTLEVLRLDTGINLRMLVEAGGDDDDDIIQQESLKLEPGKADTKVQTLVTFAEGNINRTPVFVEYKPYEFSGRRGADQRVIKRVSKLGKILQFPKAFEAGFHTLRLQKIIQQRHPTPRFAFIYELPVDAGEPINLLQAIREKNLIRPTLGERFRIARELAETLFQFHSIGWLHKSVRSENVLFFKTDETHILYTRQYLVGFEFSRDENDRSTTEQDDKLERNIYRHPDRQGPPEQRFSIIHDIYALGVVLLEIGLWRSAIGFESNYHNMTPDERKDSLVEHARYRLPHYMGVSYTDTVVACLLGSLGSYDQIDPGSVGLQREAIQVEYFKKIIGGIESGVHLV